MKKNILISKIIVLLIVFFLFGSVLVTFADSGVLLDGIRVTEKEKDDEVDFNLSSISYEIEDGFVDIYGIDIQTDLEVNEVLYSLDGGISWSKAEDLRFDLLDEEMYSERSVLNLKVITDQEESFTSVDKHIIDDEVGEKILGYFFRSNEEPVVMNNEGDVLFNPNHDLEIFVETSHSVSEVKVGYDDDYTDLTYNYTTQLWQGIVLEDVLDAKENSLEVVVGEKSLSLPDVLNVKYLDEGENRMFGDYSIYYFNGYEWRSMEYSEEDLDYSIFTMVPGEYYVRVEQDGRDLYSPIFELDERTVVSFSSTDDSFGLLFFWLEKYFLSLETNFFASDYMAVEAYSSYDVADFVELEDYVDGDKDTIFLYINAWNPLYKNYLEKFIDYSDNFEILLLTDSKNYQTLKVGIRDYDTSLELYEIEQEDLDVLGDKQPKIYLYDSNDNTIFGFQGTNLLRVLDNFISENL